MSDTTERCEDCGHPLEDWCDCECCLFKAERWSVRAMCDTLWKVIFPHGVQ